MVIKALEHGYPIQGWRREWQVNQRNAEPVLSVCLWPSLSSLMQYSKMVPWKISLFEPGKMMWPTSFTCLPAPPWASTASDEPPRSRMHSQMTKFIHQRATRQVSSFSAEVTPSLIGALHVLWYNRKLYLLGRIMRKPKLFSVPKSCP